MLFNNIVERRIVENGNHSTILEMTTEDYEKRYRDYNEKAAEEIISTHFKRRGDDGRPTGVRIKQDSDNIVRIYANVNYLGNDHTDYRKE